MEYRVELMSGILELQQKINDWADEGYILDRIVPTIAGYLLIMSRKKL